MKLKLLRKLAVTALLLALTFSAIGININPVQADRVGVGKFLTVEISGEGYVTATKDPSAVWRYDYSEPATEYKLGAGTVSLQAFPAEGWIFSHWGGDLTGTANPIDYKSEKYGYVIAVFTKSSFTITALCAPEAPNGEITTTGDGDATPITEGDELVGWSVSIESGGSQTFNFNPDEDNHLSAFQVDGAFQPYALTYTFSDVQKDYAMTVYFSADGQAYVPAGSNVPVYLGDDVGLTFASTDGGGTATQSDLLPTLLAKLQGTSLILWDVSVGVSFTGVVEVTLPIGGSQTITSVWASDDLNALYCDVNGDGIVDINDHVAVARAISTNGRSYKAAFDVNRDGHLDQGDISLVDEYLGTFLQSLVFNQIGNTLFIETDHFSIFRGR